MAGIDLKVEPLELYEGPWLGYNYHVWKAVPVGIGKFSGFKIIFAVSLSWDRRNHIETTRIFY